MKKNGFTLVELLATIAIILLFAGLAIPSVITMYNNKEEKNNQDIYSYIEEAAEVYISMENINISDTNNCINVSNLINTGVITDTDAKKIDLEIAHGFVKVTEENGIYKFKYNKSCN